MSQRRPYPYCCGGQLWMETRGCSGCGITVEVFLGLCEPEMFPVEKE